MNKPAALYMARCISVPTASSFSKRDVARVVVTGTYQRHQRLQPTCFVLLQLNDDRGQSVAINCTLQSNASARE